MANQNQDNGGYFTAGVIIGLVMILMGMGMCH